MHSVALLVAGLAVGVALASPTGSARGITLKVSQPGSPIHDQPINAVGNSLWIGTPSATFCSLKAPLCSSYTNTTTVLSCRPDTGAPGACDMTVDVPGGQRLFVRADTGALGYSLPHSTQIPPGAMISGFTYLADGASTSGQFGFMDLNTGSATTLVACATGTGCNPQTGEGCAPWSVRAALASADTTGCLSFQAVTETTNEVAWEYT